MPQLPILFLLVSFASVGAVLFTPALPAIQAFFHVSQGEAESTMTIYLLGYALGQLLYGPLANGWGRKKALYVGLFIALVGALLAAISSLFASFALLIAARFLQALGGAAGIKISFTMIGDTCSQVAAAKKIGKLMIAFAVMPGIATALGGILISYFPWESTFYALALFALFILFLATLLPETAPAIDAKALRLGAIYRAYKAKFTHRRLLHAGLIMGFGSAIVYLFATKAPFLAIQEMGLSPLAFGFWNLLPPIGILAGSILSDRLVTRFSFPALLRLGIGGTAIALLTMLIPFFFHKVDPWTLFLPMMLIYSAESVIFANISAFGLANAHDKSSGSAVLNFLNLSVVVVAISLSASLPPLPIYLPLSFLAATVAMAFFATRRL